MEKFETYFHYISSMCQEQDNTFDGQDMNKLKNMLVDSASNQDILNLASKYGLELTLSLKKQELAEYVKYQLNKQGELTKNLEVEIDALTVTGLNNLCKQYRVQMSSNMSKPELVNYLFYILEQCQITTTSVRRIETNGMFEPLEFVVDMSAFKGFKADDTKRVILYRGFEHDEFPPLGVEENETQDNSDKPLNFSKDDQEKKGPEPEVKENPTPKKAPSKKKPVSKITKEASTDTESTEELIANEEVKEAQAEEILEEPVSEEVQEKLAIEESLNEGEVIYVDEDGNPVDVEFEEEVEIIEEIQEPVNDEKCTDEAQELEELEEEILENIENEEVKEAQTDKPEEIPVKQAEDILDEDSDVSFEITDKAPKVESKKLPKDDVRENKEYGNDKLMKAANGPIKVIALSIFGALAVIGLVFVIWALLK